MLISMFWDGSSTARARAVSSAEGSTHWVRVEADGAAETTIHVASAEHAKLLADLINTLVAAPSVASEKPSDRCVALVGEQ